MPIQTDVDLVAAVEQASRLIQDIQDYTQRTLRSDAYVRFPRGVLRTAEHYRTWCPDYLARRQKDSCAYGFMYLDVLWWIAARTDLSGIALEMVYKSAIITQGTILEAMLHIPNQGIFFSACPFRKSYPDVLMMQSGQDWNGDNDTGPLDGSMQGRIFL